MFSSIRLQTLAASTLSSDTPERLAYSMWHKLVHQHNVRPPLRQCCPAHDDWPARVRSCTAKCEKCGTKQTTKLHIYPRKTDLSPIRNYSKGTHQYIVPENKHQLSASHGRSLNSLFSIMRRIQRAQLIFLCGLTLVTSSLSAVQTFTVRGKVLWPGIPLQLWALQSLRGHAPHVCQWLA